MWPPTSRDSLALCETILKRVRSIVRKAVPGAEEVDLVPDPAYKLHGRPVLYFAAFKEHYSVYPSNTRLVAAFKDELAGYELSKGTIRFPLSEPVPVKLIEGIAKFRAKEVAGLGSEVCDAEKAVSQFNHARSAGAQHLCPVENDGDRFRRVRVRFEHDETAIRRDIVGGRLIAPA